MSFGTVHPDSVRDAVAAAGLKGRKIPWIVRQLAAGQLAGHREPYELPIETARYYVKQAKNKAAASTVTTLAAGDPSKAIDHLARQALSEAELGLREVRASKTRDPDAVAKWVSVLGKIAPLVRNDPTDAGGPSRKTDKRPVDALTQRLTNPSPPSPNQVDVREGASREAAPINTPTTTPVDPPTNPPTGGVPARTLEPGAFSSLNGTGWGDPAHHV